MKAVNAGEIADRDHLPLLLVPGPGRVRRRTARTSQLHFFGNQDPGAFVSVSGAGVLKSSKHATEAQQLVELPDRREGQQALADSNALEYAVGTGDRRRTRSSRRWPSSSPPTVDLGTLDGAAGGHD